MKDWYDKNIFLNILWLISGIIWVPLYIIYEIILRIGEFTFTKKPKWFTWWGNRVDNLPDAVIQYLHCKCIPGINRSLNLAFMMKNRPRPYWPILRKCRFYDNCDPEDFYKPDETLNN